MIIVGYYEFIKLKNFNITEDYINHLKLSQKVFLVPQMVKNSTTVQETWVQFLGWENPLEEGMATCPVFLPGESPWTEEPGMLQSMGSQRVRHD